jgi:hypothetical protein
MLLLASFPIPLTRLTVSNFFSLLQDTFLNPMIYTLCSTRKIHGRKRDTISIARSQRRSTCNHRQKVRLPLSSSLLRDVSILEAYILFDHRVCCNLDWTLSLALLLVKCERVWRYEHTCLVDCRRHCGSKSTLSMVVSRLGYVKCADTSKIA